MPPTTIVGVDPGLNGAIAFLKSPTELMVYDMPTVKVVRNKKNKREVAYYGLGHLFDNAKEVDCLYIERVGAMRNRPNAKDNKAKTQGTSSLASLVDSSSLVIGVAAAHFWRIKKVQPISWKRAVGLGRGSTKSDSRAMATKLFPNYARLFARVKDDGRAEASLIAYFGWLNRGTEKMFPEQQAVWDLKNA